jgi:RNA polymerase sigma-70 factor, ECF subfamily
MSVLSIQTNASLAGESATRRDASGILSLEALWQRHARQVYTLALRLLADVNEAEAVTAEIFQRAYQGVPDQAGEERHFLLTLTIDCSLRWLREQQRLLPPDKNANPTLAISSEATPQPSYPVDLETHLLRLPDYWRVVFVLRDVLGLSHEEIAAHLRTEEAYVRRVVHRARLALRDALHERKQDA